MYDRTIIKYTQQIEIWLHAHKYEHNRKVCKT